MSACCLTVRCQSRASRSRTVEGTPGMSDDEASVRQQVVLSVSDQAQLRSLAVWLDSLWSVKVQQLPGTPGEGEQGSLDVLTVLAGSSGLMAMIKIIPEFIRARRSDFHITMTVKGEPFTLDATNVDEVLPILERLLHD